MLRVPRLLCPQGPRPGRVDPPRLPLRPKASPTCDRPPQHPARRRERAAPARPATATTTAPPPASSELAQQSWVEGAEPELAGAHRPGPSTSSSTSARPTPARPTSRCWRWRRTAAASTPHRCASSPTRPTPASPRELPAGTVGLSTGEEEIDPDAPIVCCTVEKAPMRGDLLVLDESHWVADPDRGHHWARLVLTGEYREMHLISAAEAYLLLKPLVAGRQADRPWSTTSGSPGSTSCGRRSAPRASAPQTLVVAFSRKAVYAVAAALDPHRPGQGRRPLRRAAPGDPARGHRPVHQRRARGAGDHRRHRPRHQRAGHDGAVRRDDQVRRRRAPAAAHLGDRPDRRPRRPLRADRARRRSASSPASPASSRTPACSWPAPRWPAATR